MAKKKIITEHLQNQKYLRFYWLYTKTQELLPWLFQPETFSHCFRNPEVSRALAATRVLKAFSANFKFENLGSNSKKLKKFESISSKTIRQRLGGLHKTMNFSDDITLSLQNLPHFIFFPLADTFSGLF